MARPILPTPIIYGEDAKRFLEALKLNELVSEERIRYLEICAEQSKLAEEWIEYDSAGYPHKRRK